MATLLLRDAPGDTATIVTIVQRQRAQGTGRRHHRHRGGEEEEEDEAVRRPIAR